MSKAEEYLRGEVHASRDGLNGVGGWQAKGSKMAPMFKGGAFIDSVDICWAAQSAPMPFTVS